MKEPAKAERKNRTIRWDQATDETAEQLAIEKGYMPERKNGGVSKMLADMIAARLREDAPTYHSKKRADEGRIARPAPSSKRS